MVAVIQNLHPARRVMFLIMMALIVVGFVVGAVWLLKTDYQPLFEKLDEQAAANTIAKLEEQQIPYQVQQNSFGNSIAVPAEQVERLRVVLTQELGLPDVRGMELFDNADYSMTDFSQEITFQRAMQGELARTIASMPGIKSARVHLTFAPKRLFGIDQQSAKASVFLEQEPASQLAAAQVVAIQKLVANSVERLASQHVAVFGANGLELSRTGEEKGMMDVDQKYAAKYAMEQRLTEKAYRLLSLSLDPSDVAVSVDVTMNFDQRKKRTQGYANQDAGQATVLRQKERSVTKPQQPLDKGGNAATPEQTLSQEKEVEYAHGQETEETVFSAGRVQEIAVGVAIRRDLDIATQEKLREVLAAGLGIKPLRGDQLALQVLDIAPKVAVPTAATTASQVQPQTLPEGKVGQPQTAASGTTSVKGQADVARHSMAQQALGLWWLLLLPLLPAGLWYYRKRQLGVKQREALLLEVQAWLEKEEQQYGNV